MSALTGDILISDGGVRWAKSNPLHFTRTDNQAGTEQTLDNRTVDQLLIPNVTTNWSFRQRFKIGDLIPNQFATIHTIDSFKVYNFQDNSLIEEIAVPAVSNSINDITYGTVNFYDFQIDTSLYGGYYYVIATINTTQIYKSEMFYVSDYTSEDGVLLKWYNSISSYYNDGIDYTASPVNLMRVDSRFYRIELGEIVEKYEGFLGKPVQLSGQPLRYIIFELDEMPSWMVEKINLAILHEYFTINNVKFVKDGSFEVENAKLGQKGTLIYNGEIKMQQTQYEVYEELEAATPIETNFIKTKKGYLKTKKGFVKRK